MPQVILRVLRIIIFPDTKATNLVEINFILWHKETKLSTVNVYVD